MADTQACPECGRSLTAGEECPECLLQLGLMADPGDTPTGTKETSHPDVDAPKQNTIGPYRLLQKVGEGGMGEVWEAEQTEPVKRRVALKIIKRGMDTRQVVARFEAERQALAMMDHPNLAKVFDAGTTPRGRPYFVMEYVPGDPITKHCDRHRLTMHERLELFREVCDGVQHAHQKAIIHRDLKPSNVLVTVQGDKRIPKIIDFGVAKATAQKLTEKTLFTELGVLIGTPEYMSPEQVDLTGENIDTRTDVYSLGVMLYQLLVGALPFDSRELRRAGFDEIRRRIREDEPPKPSVRLSTLGDRTGEAARSRRLDPPTLRRQLRGDLDWITMRALEKDRARRYGSPSELAADIERYLTHQPVVAGPPSTLYRTRKFLRRHRLSVSVAAAAAVLLVSFAARERMQSRKIAREAETATQITEFLIGLFEVSDPSEARGNTITAREILDQGASRIEHELSDRPRVQARLMATMGDVYASLGLYPQARDLLEPSVERLRDLVGGDHLETLSATQTLAMVDLQQGGYEAAAGAMEPIVDQLRRRFGDEDPEVLGAMSNLGEIYWEMGRFEDGERLLGVALENGQRVLGPEHPGVLVIRNNLTLVYRGLGRLEEAVELERETLAIRRRVLGDDHPFTLASMELVGLLYQDLKRFDEAEPLMTESLRLTRRVMGDDHDHTMKAMNNLAFFYSETGEHEKAEPLFVDMLATAKRTLGDDHPGVLISMGNLGDLYTSGGRHDEAERLLVAAVEGLRTSLPTGHPAAGFTARKYGRCLTAQGRYAEAEGTLLDAHAILVEAVGEEHLQTAKAVRNLVELYEAWGLPDKAAEWRTVLPQDD